MRLANMQLDKHYPLADTEYKDRLVINPSEFDTKETLCEPLPTVGELRGLLEVQKSSNQGFSLHTNTESNTSRSQHRCKTTLINYFVH